jgi:hypothetical protein
VCFDFIGPLLEKMLGIIMSLLPFKFGMWTTILSR